MTSYIDKGPDGSYLDEDAYELDDPKHSTWADRMADRADMDRKREKEQGDIDEVEGHGK